MSLCVNGLILNLFNCLNYLVTKIFNYQKHLYLLGFLGTSCEEKIDPCASSPCQNNGTCYADRLVYSCSCSSGFTGPTCAQLIDFCALNPCAHGICRSVGTSYKCLCSPGLYQTVTLHIFISLLVFLYVGFNVYFKITSFFSFQYIKHIEQMFYLFRIMLGIYTFHLENQKLQGKHWKYPLRSIWPGWYLLLYYRRVVCRINLSWVRYQCHWSWKVWGKDWRTWQ